MQQINEFVNNSVEEVSDEEQFGKKDVWDLPLNGRGDCEDYALLKRKMLLDRGWPAGALLLTAGFTEEGVPHVVLNVRTDKGEYVLDSRRSDLRTPARTGYALVSQQSARDPRKWVSLATGDVTTEPVVDLPVRQSQMAPRR